MVDDLLTQLSEAQINCLRLVAANRSSKEIALETGLSHQTVDQYISRAAAVLGAANRREAARILAELEREAFRKPEFKPEPVVLPENSPTMASSTGQPADGQGAPDRSRNRLRTWLPEIGGTRHDLDTAQTIHAILRVSLFTMGTAGAIIAIVFWLNRLML